MLCWYEAVISSNNLSESIVSRELSTESPEEAPAISVRLKLEGVK